MLTLPCSMLQEMFLVLQQIISSQNRAPTSKSPQSPFIATSRGTPVQYPVNFKLNGRISTVYRKTKEYTFPEVTCLVNANVTLHKIHVVKFTGYSDDKVEVSVKQDFRYLHTETYYYNNARARGPPKLDTFDNEKAVSFDFPGVKIKQGHFVLRFKYRNKSSNDWSRPVLTYSPSWQKTSAAYVEWWCKTKKTPFYGLQFRIDP